MFSKILAIGVIFLFVSIYLIPEVKANDFEKDNRSRDEYKEIITFIRGLWVSLEWINKRGNFRGEVNLTNDDWGIFKLFGLGWSNGKIVYFEESATFIHAYRFIGYYEMSAFGDPYVNGIAMGNIEWYNEK